MTGPSTRRASRRRRASIARESSRDPRSRVNWSRRRATRSRVSRVIVFSAFPSLYGGRTEGEGPRTPERSNRVGTKPPSRWDIAGRTTAPAPQSKPVTQPHASWRDSAVGGLRVWAEDSGRRASLTTDLTPIATVVCANPKIWDGQAPKPSQHCGETAAMIEQRSSERCLLSSCGRLLSLSDEHPAARRERPAMRGLQGARSLHVVPWTIATVIERPRR